MSQEYITNDEYRRAYKKVFEIFLKRIDIWDAFNKYLADCGNSWEDYNPQNQYDYVIAGIDPFSTVEGEDYWNIIDKCWQNFCFVMGLDGTTKERFIKFITCKTR